MSLSLVSEPRGPRSCCVTSVDLRVSLWDALSQSQPLKFIQEEMEASRGSGMLVGIWPAGSSGPEPTDPAVHSDPPLPHSPFIHTAQKQSNEKANSMTLMSSACFQCDIWKIDGLWLLRITPKLPGSSENTFPPHEPCSSQISDPCEELLYSALYFIHVSLSHHFIFFKKRANDPYSKNLYRQMQNPVLKLEKKN